MKNSLKLGLLLSVVSLSASSLYAMNVIAQDVENARFEGYMKQIGCSKCSKKVVNNQRVISCGNCKGKPASISYPHGQGHSYEDLTLENGRLVLRNRMPMIPLPVLPGRDPLALEKK